ncbi:MAG: hypothetical protein ABGY41_02670 [Candidatus Poribacteria bacterium]
MKLSRFVQADTAAQQRAVVHDFIDEVVAMFETLDTLSRYLHTGAPGMPGEGY